MLLAPNVVVHDPETDLAKISSERLRAHGWPAAAIELMDKARSIYGASVPEVSVPEPVPAQSDLASTPKP